MIPKSLALQQAETMALWITPPMLWIKTLVFPLVVGLNGIGNALLRLLGVNRQAQSAEQYYTPEELQLVVQESEERGAHPRRVRTDAAGALRLRQPDGGRGHGAARADHGPAARQRARRASASCSAARRIRAIPSSSTTSITSSA